MKTKENILILGAVLIVLLSATFFCICRTARYAFYRAGKAIRTHDVALFTTYVDVDAVVDEWVVWGTQKAKQELLEMKSELENPLREDMIELMMPNLRMKLKEEFKRSIMQNLETGMLTGGLPVLNMVLLPIKKIEVKEKIAQVIVQHPVKDEQIFFKLRCMPQGFWKIVSIQIPSLMRLDAVKPATQKNLPTKPSAPVAAQETIPLATTPAAETTQPTLAPSPRSLQETAAASLQRDYVLTKTMVYTEYYQQVRDLIKDKISSLANKGYKGEIELKLVLLPNGKIKNVAVHETKETVNTRIKKLTLKAAKMAAPYPAFPKELQSSEETFDILISFE